MVKFHLQNAATSMKKPEPVNDQEIVINVEALTRDLNEKMSGGLTMPAVCSILRVPIILSRHCPSAYKPNQFSFGPFHHDNPTLKPTEKIKAKYLQDLLNRFEEPKKMLDALNTAVIEVWKQARDYYAGPIDMEPEQFVEVMVLDGCFIVELFRRWSYKSLQKENDPIFAMSCFHQFLWHDLILLENQVPWMVLDLLFNETVTSIDEKKLVQLAIEFFATIFSFEPLQINPEESMHSKHILDLLRDSIVTPFRATSSEKSKGWSAMRSATNLQESGIQFKAKNNRSILNIRFEKKLGELGIPSLFIQEITETVLRNLISLEQSCPNYEAIVTSYAVLLNNLIDTKEDLEILCKSNVIRTWLNVDEATKLFYKLYIDTYVKEMYYVELTRDVEEYCHRRWPAYRRVFMHDFSTNPWTLISVTAALIGLILTFLQTWFAIAKG